MNWGKEYDAFDLEVVKKAVEEREQNESDRRPDGSPGLTCRYCGRVQSAYALPGSCCYNCFSTLGR
jgi:hypothetical protein